MVCPFCLHKKIAVYNSRATKRLNGMWRRRRCLHCKREFTTRETIDVESILRVRSAGNKRTLTPFSRATLLLSLSAACDHRQKGDNAAYWLSDTVEQELIRLAKDGVITTEDIVNTCLKVLKRFDTPAFIKYLAYHSPATADRVNIKKQLRNNS